MSQDTLPDMDEVVYEPDEAFVESTNVHAFMEDVGVDTIDELVERCRDVDWFWDYLPEYLGVEFYEDYDAVRDDADGPQFSDWYPGGEINVAHNTVDRWAQLDAPERNRVEVIVRRWHDRVEAEYVGEPRPEGLVGRLLSPTLPGGRAAALRTVTQR